MSGMRFGAARFRTREAFGREIANREVPNRVVRIKPVDRYDRVILNFYKKMIIFEIGQ